MSVEARLGCPGRDEAAAGTVQPQGTHKEAPRRAIVAMPFLPRVLEAHEARTGEAPPHRLKLAIFLTVIGQGVWDRVLAAPINPDIAWRRETRLSPPWIWFGWIPSCNSSLCAEDTTRKRARSHPQFPNTVLHRRTLAPPPPAPSEVEEGVLDHVGGYSSILTCQPPRAASPRNTGGARRFSPSRTRFHPLHVEPWPPFSPHAAEGRRCHREERHALEAQHDRSYPSRSMLGQRSGPRLDTRMMRASCSPNASPTAVTVSAAFAGHGSVAVRRRSTAPSSSPR